MFENGIIKLKITQNTNVTTNSQKITPEQLKLDQGIRTIFQIYAIWISGDLFGLYLKPIIIDQKYKLIEQINFIASESDNDTVYNTDVDNLTEYNNGYNDSDLSDESELSDSDQSNSDHSNQSKISNQSNSNHSKTSKTSNQSDQKKCNKLNNSTLKYNLSDNSDNNKNNEKIFDNLQDYSSESSNNKSID